MTRNYLTHKIEPLPWRRQWPDKRKPRRPDGKRGPSTITQREASVRYNIPAIIIRWAVDMDRIDVEHGGCYTRRLVVNARLHDWVRHVRKSLRNDRVYWTARE